FAPAASPARWHNQNKIGGSPPRPVPLGCPPVPAVPTVRVAWYRPEPTPESHHGSTLACWQYAPTLDSPNGPRSDFAAGSPPPPGPWSVPPNPAGSNGGR